MVRRSVFDKIYREMQQINLRLDRLERSLSAWNPPTLNIPEAKLISLSDHLRKTYITVASKGQCNANVVSISTGRCRALESNYLNQLCRMGWLNKHKASKSTVFCLAQELTPRKELHIEANNNLNRPIGHFEKDFRKFFAEP
jgi:hypothetical protein